jgi:BirA family biotin operon repressor/biotin-[acetyl-CoA-carboxylase] ligase
MLLKWPNDLLVYDGKIAGILLERHDDAIVVGIGINVTHAPELPDRKTESLEGANGKLMGHADKVLDDLADRFAECVKQWREMPLSRTLLEWTVRSHRYNDRIRITGSDGEVMHANYRGIDESGALKVQPLGAHETIVHAGDVTLEWHDKE